MDEKTLRVHLSAVFRGAAIVAVLTILRTIAFKLPGVDTMVGSLNAGGYIFLALTIAILFVLVRAFSPLREVVGYYLGVSAKVGKIPGREQYLTHLVPLSKTVVLFVYVILVYQYLSPVAVILNEAFLRWGDGLYKTIGLTAVGVGVLCLWQMWQHAAPLIDVFSGKLSSSASAATVRMVTTTCPGCGVANDRELKFCSACGANLAPPPAPPAPAAPPSPALVPPLTLAPPPALAAAPAPTAPPPPSPPAARFCTACGVEIAAAAKFCGSCGAQAI